MRTLLVLCLAALVSGSCSAKKHKSNEPFPTEMVIGRDSFIDIGPPFNYYDLTLLRSDGERTEVERLSLTPPSDSCYPRVEIKSFQLVLHESLSSLLHATNPCSIPEKAVRAELKRRRKGLSVFSGMDVTIQVQCGKGPRLIRADILDRDIFGEHPNTPRYTAWSQALFEKVDQATGDRPWETPLFPVADSSAPAPPLATSKFVTDIAAGNYDAIFGQGLDRPSILYRLAQNPPRQPIIELTESDPVRPVTFVSPVYPPIAKVAHVHGNVAFHLIVGENGSPQNVAVDSGPKMLWQATADAIAKWEFAQGESGKTVHGSVRFGLDCTPDSKDK